jgi:hypothetical protein
MILEALDLPSWTVDYIDSIFSLVKAIYVVMVPLIPTHSSIRLLEVYTCID